MDNESGDKETCSSSSSSSSLSVEDNRRPISSKTLMRQDAFFQWLNYAPSVFVAEDLSRTADLNTTHHRTFKFIDLLYDGVFHRAKGKGGLFTETKKTVLTDSKKNREKFKGDPKGKVYLKWTRKDMIFGEIRHRLTLYLFFFLQDFGKVGLK